MAMATLEKVTVDKADFDALLRRADFHTQTALLGRPDPTNVAISKVEYDNLLRVCREYELLKAALFQGGITPETLHTLISSEPSNGQRKDSDIPMDAWADDSKDQASSQIEPSQLTSSAPYRPMPWRTSGRRPASNSPPGPSAFSGNGHSQHPQSRAPNVHRQQRQPSNGHANSYPEDTTFDENVSFGGDDDNFPSRNVSGSAAGGVLRTLYFSGLSERTTYRDLLSIIKGGKLLSVTFRSERTATVSFLDGAADFLAWAKRNDIYLNAKRIEVKWADRQFSLNTHVSNKIASGATRNLLIRGVLAKGLNEQTIRDDMEHIHNLVIIDITCRNGDAYVSTNSVHNALYARTCMMSRFTYKGCKVEFYRDECDVPFPQRVYVAKSAATAARQANGNTIPTANRFGMLDMDGTEASSDEENRTPPDEDEDEAGTGELDVGQGYGVRLDFLDGESTA